MTATEPSEILRVEELQGRRFRSFSCRIQSGRGTLVYSGHFNSLGELINLICGLDQDREGKIRFFDQYDPGHKSRQPSFQRIGFVSVEADMISNLKIWENLILPLQARKGPAISAEIEGQIIEAFIAAGFGQSWIESTLPSQPDGLSNFEKVVCGLVRSHITGFRLLVCENIFGQIDEAHTLRLVEFLNWIGNHHPDSGLLLIHHGSTAPKLPGLTAWQPIEILNLNEKP